jgi:hypothetical protein
VMRGSGCKRGRQRARPLVRETVRESRGGKGKGGKGVGDGEGTGRCRPLNANHERERESHNERGLSSP